MSGSIRPAQRPTLPQRPMVIKPAIEGPAAIQTARNQQLQALRQAQEDRERKDRRPLRRTPLIDISSPVLLTGFYESTPFSPTTSNSAFTMQINQAGQTLVGWFSETPSFVKDREPLRSYKAAPPSDNTLGYGFFSAEFLQTSLRKVNSVEYHVPIYIIRIPQAPENGINTFDPIWDASPREGELNASGWLRIEPEQPPVSIVPPTEFLPKIPPLLPRQKLWIVTGISFSSAESPFDPVHRTSRRPRLSYVAMAQQGELLRDALLANHAAVLPESFIEQQLKQVTRLWVYGISGPIDKGPPAIEPALDHWLAAQSTIEKNLTREPVLSALREFHAELLNLPLASHRTRLRDLFRDHSRLSMKRTPNGSVSYFSLYQEIIAEEIANTHPKVVDLVLQPILKLQTFPAFSSKDKRYRYLLSFDPLQGVGNAPGSVTKAISKALGGVGMDVGLYGVGLTRQRVEYETEPNGIVKIDRVSGNPTVKRVLQEVDVTKSISDTSRWTAMVACIGFSPSEPVKVALDTPLDDLSYDDFAESNFHFVSVTGGVPGVKLGAVAELKPASTGFFMVTLTKRRNLELYGSVTEVPKLSSPTVDKGKKLIEKYTKSPQSISDVAELAKTPYGVQKDMRAKGAEKYAEEWLDSYKLSAFKADFSKIVSISLGYGWVGSGKGWGAVPSGARTALLPDPERTETGMARLEEKRFFLRDSASIDIQKPWSSTGMPLRGTIGLELFLAMSLYLFLSPTALLSVKGYASPEGPEGPLADEDKDDPYNTELSLDRASVVYEAIRYALEIYGDDWTNQLDLDGYGEVPARNRHMGNLKDPPSTLDLPAFKAWCQANQDEVAKWPLWRKVEVEIAGMVAFTLSE